VSVRCGVGGDKKRGANEVKSGRELILRNISILWTQTFNCSGFLLIGIHPDDVTLWGDVKHSNILKHAHREECPFA
jgi:hypothetical protein